MSDSNPGQLLVEYSENMQNILNQLDSAADEPDPLGGVLGDAEDNGAWTDLWGSMLARVQGGEGYVGNDDGSSQPQLQLKPQHQQAQRGGAEAKPAPNKVALNAPPTMPPPLHENKGRAAGTAAAAKKRGKGKVAAIDRVRNAYGGGGGSRAGASDRNARQPYKPVLRPGHNQRSKSAHISKVRTPAKVWGVS